MNIFDKVKSLDLPKDKYIVISGAALEGYGIRKRTDINILVTKDVYRQYKKKKGWKEKTKPSGMKVLEKGLIEIGYDCGGYGGYNSSTEALIQEAVIIQGAPFLSIDELLKQKMAWVREKDKNDIKLIKAYLSKRKLK